MSSIGENAEAKLREYKKHMIAEAKKSAKKMQTINDFMYNAFKEIAYDLDIDHIKASSAFHKFSDKSMDFLEAFEKLDDCLREIA